MKAKKKVYLHRYAVRVQREELYEVTCEFPSPKVDAIESHAAVFHALQNIDGKTVVSTGSAYKGFEINHVSCVEK